MNATNNIRIVNFNKNSISKLSFKQIIKSNVNIIQRGQKLLYKWLSEFIKLKIIYNKNIIENNNESKFKIFFLKISILKKINDKDNNKVNKILILLIKLKFSNSKGFKLILKKKESQVKDKNKKFNFLISFNCMRFIFQYNEH